MVAEATKYQGKWSVFFPHTRTYLFIGYGKRFCLKKAKEINNEAKFW